MRYALVLVAAALVAAGCGASDANTAGDLACDKATGPVDAHAAVSPVPAGYVVRAAKNPQILKRITDYYATRLGPRYRGSDDLVLTRKGETDGVAVILVTIDRAAAAQDVVRGARDAAAKQGVTLQDLQVGGRPGVLGGDDKQGWYATSTSGSCSALLLVSATEQRIRDLAPLLPERD